MRFLDFKREFCGSSWTDDACREEYQSYVKAQTFTKDTPAAPLPPGDYAVTEQELHAALHEVGALLRIELAKRDKLIAELQATTMKHRGVWDAERTYMPGDACTRSGATWLARAATIDCPPGSGPNWILIAKSSRGEPK